MHIKSSAYIATTDQFIVLYANNSTVLHPIIKKNEKPLEIKHLPKQLFEHGQQSYLCEIKSFSSHILQCVLLTDARLWEHSS